jgi:hypothetical protein
MSYDLEAYRLPPGADPATYEPDEDADLRPPTPEERAAMARLADALHGVDPSAERYDDELFIEIDTAQAIQVSLYADSAGVTVPYCTGTRARRRTR